MINIHLFFFFLFLFLDTDAQNPETVQMSSQEFSRIISAEPGVLLDVRTQREFKNGQNR
jgi:hypothetical protein